MRTRQLAYDLGAYKSNAHDPTRDRLTALLASLLSAWLVRHERCLARSAGLEGSFDVVTVVPSTRPRTEQRLQTMVGELSTASAPRFVRLLEPPAEQPPAHTPDDRIFRVMRPPGPSSVLVIDDTWTTGSFAQSAASALRAAGAAPVAILAIGRHFGGCGGVRGRGAGQTYIDDLNGRRWSREVCSLCTFTAPAEGVARAS